MKVSYDEKTDTLSMILKDNTPVAESRERIILATRMPAGLSRLSGLSGLSRLSRLSGLSGRRGLFCLSSQLIARARPTGQTR